MLIPACAQKPAGEGGQAAQDDGQAAVEDDAPPRVETVLTKEEQDKLTPDEVIESLLQGNQRFVKGKITKRDHTAQVRAASLGQYPKSVILSCLDSRIPVEDVFDRGIGDLFVARIAGNFVNTDILGSMEFACKVSGAKLIMVLGHEHCGAVKGAIDNVELGNLTATLSNIKPAVEKVTDVEGERTSSNEAFVHEVAEANVRLAMDMVRDESEILKEMEAAGDIKISVPCTT